MKSNYLYINSRDELLRVELTSIVYFEADGNYTNVISSNGLKGLIGMNLAKMEKTIAATPKRKSVRFARIGKRYIINMGYIYQISPLAQTLVLSDQKSFSYDLAISKEALKKLKEIVVDSIER